MKSKEKKKQLYISEIQSECNKLSNTFITLAKAFQKLSSHIITEEETKEEENLSEDDSSFHVNEDLIVKDENKKTFLKKKRLHQHKKILFGRILTLRCVDDGKKVNGYTTHVTYKGVALLIGPFKEYEFAIRIKNTLLDNLEKIKCTDENYTSVITQCFNDIKNNVYKKYPPLMRAKDFVSKEPIEEIDKNSDNSSNDNNNQIV